MTRRKLEDLDDRPWRAHEAASSTEWYRNMVKRIAARHGVDEKAAARVADALLGDFVKLAMIEGY
jgi:hypothetical protein